MLWRKKVKTHVPFEDDWNWGYLVVPGPGNNHFWTYTFPQSCYYELLSVSFRYDAPVGVGKFQSHLAVLYHGEYLHDVTQNGTQSGGSWIQWTFAQGVDSIVGSIVTHSGSVRLPTPMIIPPGAVMTWVSQLGGAGNTVGDIVLTYRYWRLY